MYRHEKGVTRIGYSRARAGLGDLEAKFSQTLS